MKTIKCYCGGVATLQPNSVIYGRKYGNGWAWVCENFASCNGSVGTHPDKRPLGTIPDPETKKLRMQVHAQLDPLWRSGRFSRAKVYARLSDAIGRPFHTGETTAAECREVLKTIPLLFSPATQ